MEDLVAFLGYIRSSKGMDSFFSKVYQYLLDGWQIRTEELIFDQWALLKLKLFEVYESMPIASWDDDIRARQWRDASDVQCPSLEHFLRYVGQVGGELKYDVLISLPKKKASAEILRDYLKELGKGHVKEHASQLLAALDANV